MNRGSKWVVTLGVLSLVTGLGIGVSVSGEGAEHFERLVVPLLEKHCFECHSHGADKIKGGLLLDSGQGIELGGDSGKLVDRANLESGLIWKAIDPEYRDLEMPPDNPLSRREIEVIRQWLSEGGIVPESYGAGLLQDGTETGDSKVFDIEKRKESHWAWLAVRSGFQHDHLDRFIEDGLQEAGLKPNPTARPEVLIRRLSYQLTGLPPTSDEIAKFLEAYGDDPQEAYINLVGRMLESPQFGEHWARHWLDVVRYSETKGHVTDQERPYGWKYRDYVIHAFNEDLPYDRFILEQLAGDQIPEDQFRPGWNGQENVAPIATGVLFMHEMHFMSVDPLAQRWDEINSQIELTGKAFLGMTLDCARCHDHKFDAISQEDYFALAGIFQSTQQARLRTKPRELPTPDSPEGSHILALEEEYESFLKEKIAGRYRALSPKVGTDAFPVSEELGIQSPGDTKAILSKIHELESKDPNWAFWTRGANDAMPIDASMHIRGNYKNPGDVIKRGIPRALTDHLEASRLSEDNRLKSGRMWLAEKIASEKNPLTARVWANRIWHHLFGAGIVRTTDNFGVLGDMPSHPELLDFLAGKLIQSGWSTKAVIREIVLSDTWRQSSETSIEAEKRDPDNRYLSHQNRRKMTAEQIRDSLLKVSGMLDATMYGPSIDPFIPPYATANKASIVPRSGPVDGHGRRSIYIKVRRNFYDPFIKAFNFPEVAQISGVRAKVTNPQQALAMMNSPFIHHLTSHWGKALARDNSIAEPDSRYQALNKLWWECFGHGITQEQMDLVDTLIKSLRSTGEGRNMADSELWKHILQVIINQDTFIHCR